MSEGAPLFRKLGIKEGSRVALIRAPERFADALEPLPHGATIVTGARRPLDVIVLFANTRADLGHRFEGLAARLTPAGGLWIAYPKKSSGVPSNLDFASVQEIGLDAGLVDNKSCAVDDVWTAVRFVIRRRDRLTGAQ